jgi:hypothetical protein
MKSAAIASAALSFAVSAIPIADAGAQVPADQPGTSAESPELTITIDNFVRAATDVEFGKAVATTGGVNRFFHLREPTPIDAQTVIRMNRDTLYSTAIVDISEGATLTLPDTGERYMSTMIVNADHYINKVFLGGGTYKLDMDSFDTPYVMVSVRTLVDAADPDDVAEVNALQDQFVIEAASSKPFEMPDYDEETFEAVLNAAKALARFVPNAADMFGPREAVEPVRHFLGTAFGWGGLPEEQAYYLNVEPGLDVGEYRIEVPAEVPVDAFWSVSLYNAEGFYEENALGAYNVNSVTAERNEDGSVTVHLGGCDDERVNCLPIMDGWNYTVRLYRPRPEILDGSWVFPAVEPVQ